jgi:hypothetical protein
MPGIVVPFIISNLEYFEILKIIILQLWLKRVGKGVKKVDAIVKI